MHRFVLLSAALLIANAATCDDYRIQERISAIEDELDAMRNPPSYTEPVSFRTPSGVFVNKGEFLWWKTYTRTLPYAAHSNIVTSPFGGIALTGEHLNYIHFPSSPGFRIGMGYVFDFGKWEFDLLWTRYSTYGTDSERADGVTSTLFFLQATPFFSFDAQRPSTASAQSKLKLNVVDFEASRTFWPSCHTSLKPVFGFRVASITHSMDTYYNGFDGAGVAFEDHSYVRRRIRGGGLRMGGEFRMLILAGWEIYSNGFTSMILAKQTETESDAITNGTDTLNVGKFDKPHRLLSTIQLGAGLKWGSYLWGKHTYLSLQAGYESTTWYNYNQSSVFFPPNVAANLIDSDLDIAGWVFGAKLLY